MKKMKTRATPRTRTRKTVYCSDMHNSQGTATVLKTKVQEIYKICEEKIYTHAISDYLPEKSKKQNTCSFGLWENHNFQENMEKNPLKIWESVLRGMQGM